jgi:hypothetical protein
MKEKVIEINEAIAANETFYIQQVNRIRSRHIAIL